LTGQGFGTYRLVTVREFGLGLTDELYGGENQAKGGLQIRAGFSAHNDYVKAAVELGAPGLLLWTAVLIGAASVAWVARRHEALRPWAIATAVLGLVLAAMSFSDNVQGYTAVLLYAFAMAGALAGAHHGLTVRGGAPSEAGARDGG
jgi:O-antigen ligase